ncbi:protein LIFEGUARD 4-like [Malania oleifera]|uniref:protein LIFEGUARD 4-like n=1 Tax=Malania oleifera TaxID=397392 RepID=UPI0025ADB0CA|nr:protein LIFEGUARD 4-like [Malania oleifera]
MYPKVGDLEAGNNGRLYPTMLENPQFRWAFIRKVYTILSVQFLLTVGVAAGVVFTPRVSQFFGLTKPGLIIYFAVVVSTFILVCILSCFHNRHPLNFILLGLFTIAMAFVIGMACAFTHGKIVMLAVILTSVAVVSLTLFTFWGAWRGLDFSFLEPFLFCAFLILTAFVLLQVFWPMGKLGQTCYGAAGAIIFSGYLIYDTDNLIKRFDYDHYVLASATLYTDIINIFSMLLTMLRG